MSITDILRPLCMSAAPVSAVVESFLACRRALIDGRWTDAADRQRLAGIDPVTLAAHAANLHLGHGLDPASQTGPLVSAVQAELVAGHVEGGRQQGAELVTGGRLLGSNRTFFEPMVITHAIPDMRLMREEIFGPVACVTPFDEVDKVVAPANDSDTGVPPVPGPRA